MDILEEIVTHKRVELEQYRAALSLGDLEKLVRPMLDTPVVGGSMRAALMKSATGIISEFKRKSPSKGWIKEEGKAEEIPLSYERNGAAALSILTDENYFGGRDEFISTARRSGVTIPVLYKNFVIDEYQLLQARRCGASAVLLIAACLSKERCSQLMREAFNLGLDVLLEMHSEPELEYTELAERLSDLPRPGRECLMCGINNRNLGTFVTKVENSYRLASLLPKEACKVSESGISNPQTVSELREAGFNGFLIGENFMKTDNPGAALKEFIANIR